jgi:hypothetical protein
MLTVYVVELLPGIRFDIATNQKCFNNSVINEADESETNEASVIKTKI